MQTCLMTSHNRLRIQESSFPQVDSVIYYSSQKDIKIAVSLFIRQYTGVMWNVTIYPIAERRVSASWPQSVSTEATISSILVLFYAKNNP